MSEIKLTGVVKMCLPVVSGTSRTGKNWMKQSFVLEYEGGNYPRTVKFDVIGEEKLRNFGIREGETITVSLDINSREYNGNYYNDITCWRVEREQANAPAQQPQPQPQYQAVSNGVIYPEAPMPAPEAAPVPKEGDLPF